MCNLYSPKLTFVCKRTWNQSVQGWLFQAEGWHVTLVNPINFSLEEYWQKWANIVFFSLFFCLQGDSYFMHFYFLAQGEASSTHRGYISFPHSKASYFHAIQGPFSSQQLLLPSNFSVVRLSPSSTEREGARLLSKKGLSLSSTDTKTQTFKGQNTWNCLANLGFSLMMSLKVLRRILIQE